MDGKELIAVSTLNRDIAATDRSLVPTTKRANLAPLPAIIGAGRTGERQPDMAIEFFGKRASGEPGRISRSYYAKYNVDAESRRVWIQVVDMSSQEVVLEIPAEQIREMAKELQKYLDQGNGRIARTQASGG